MADHDWVDVDGSYGTTKQKRKSAAGRKLVRWNPALDQLVALCIDYVCVKNGIALPYDEIAREVAPQLSGEGLKQHFAKVIKARADAGQKVPPKLPKSARRAAIKESALQEDTDTEPASLLLWHAPEKKKKRSGKHNYNSSPASTFSPLIATPDVNTQVYSLSPLVPTQNNPVSSTGRYSRDLAAVSTSLTGKTHGVKRSRPFGDYDSDEDYAPSPSPAKKVKAEPQKFSSQGMPTKQIQQSMQQSSLSTNKWLSSPQIDWKQPTDTGYNAVSNGFQDSKPAYGMQGNCSSRADVRGQFNISPDQYASPVTHQVQQSELVNTRSNTLSSPTASEITRQETRTSFMLTASLDALQQWGPEFFQEALNLRAQQSQGSFSANSHAQMHTPESSPPQQQQLVNNPDHTAYKSVEYVNMNDLRHDASGHTGQMNTPRFIPRSLPEPSGSTYNGYAGSDPNNSGLNATLSSDFHVDMDGYYTATNSVHAPAQDFNASSFQFNNDSTNSYANTNSAFTKHENEQAVFADSSYDSPHGGNLHSSNTSNSQSEEDLRALFELGFGQAADYDGFDGLFAADS